MDNLSQSIYLKVGEVGTPLKKISLSEKKELKVTMKKFLDAEYNIPDNFLLRAYIASGLPIDKKLITFQVISSALSFKDILKNANKLSKKEELIDASALFQSINKSLLKTKSTKIVRPIINFTNKWVNKARFFNMQLTNKTEESIIATVNQLTINIPTPKNLNEKTLVKYKKLINPLFEILFELVSKSKSYDTYILFLQGINNIVKKFPSLFINELLSNDKYYEKLQIFEKNLLKESEYQILQGHSDKIEEMNKSILESPFSDIHIIFKEGVENVWDTQGATLDGISQSKIRNILYDEQSYIKPFEMSSRTSISSSIKQLATALISSWDARNEGTLAMDSFKLFSSVAEKYFNLKIGGKVGELTSFSRIAHEPLRNAEISENTEIVIVRPWVELKEPGGKTILIKALVKEKE